MPRGATNTSGAGTTKFASRTAFDALAVDDLPSDRDDVTDTKPVTRSETRARKAKKSKSGQANASDAKGGGATRAVSSKAEPAKSAATNVTPAKPAAADNAGPAAVKTEATEVSAEPTAATVAPSQTTEPSKSKSESSNKAVSESARPKKQPANDTFWKKVQDRTLYTFVMIGGFIAVLLMGPAYMVLLVLILETLVYREITSLFNAPNRVHISNMLNPGYASEGAPSEELECDTRREVLWSKILSWYFFAVCNFFLYGESLLFYFKHFNSVAYIMPVARHHQFISFMLYILGFVAFVSNLRRTNLKHQFSLFCWIHMSLLLIAMSSHFLALNILEGMIWFWLPASLVICNDVFAYVCGMLFGRTPLIALSPKKTVEGFIGAFIITEIFAWFWAGFFQRFSYMICPVVDLGMNALSNTTCDVNPVFIPHSVALPGVLAQIASAIAGSEVTRMHWTMFQVHALVMAAFASLVAPFGGFFASGFKRAFNIKDFGDSIPGHGGLTDRFDCQFIMGLFSHVYYTSLISEPRVSVEVLLQLVVTQLSSKEQVDLAQQLQQYMAAKGLVK